MPRSLATISYLLAIAPAVAQTSDATAGGIPWTCYAVVPVVVRNGERARRFGPARVELP